MNSEQLSKRLEKVAAFIPKGSRLADIGSDHAYLPCFLAKKKLISSAIAGEVVQGPFLSARRQVKSEGLEDIIDVRMGNGLEVITPGEVDCISIAGMGGTLIAEILEAGKDKLSSVKRLVLQPNVSAKSIRSWLHDNGWELMDETILEEDEKIYEVLVAEKGDPARPYIGGLEKGFLLGPFLIKEKQDAFIKKWESEIENWQKILTRLEFAQESSETAAKREEILKKIALVEEVLEQ